MTASPSDYHVIVAEELFLRRNREGRQWSQAIRSNRSSQYLNRGPFYLALAPFIIETHFGILYISQFSTRLGFIALFMDTLISQMRQWSWRREVSSNALGKFLLKWCPASPHYHMINVETILWLMAAAVSGRVSLFEILPLIHSWHKAFAPKVMAPTPFCLHNTNSSLSLTAQLAELNAQWLLLCNGIWHVAGFLMFILHSYHSQFLNLK